MYQHTGMEAHDGYVQHSHEVRLDHEGVAILNTPGTERTTETILNYVVTGRVRNLPWRTLQHAGDEESHALVAYRSWLKSRGSLEVRLIRRVAVVTDEILREGVQGMVWTAWHDLGDTPFAEGDEAEAKAAAQPGASAGDYVESPLGTQFAWNPAAGQWTEV